MIQPGIGRIVHYRPAGADAAADPHAAMIVGIHGDRSVNLTIFDQDGAHYQGTAVTLLQDDDAPPVGAAYAEWMPFQKGQAGKTDAMGGELLKAVANLQADVDGKFQKIGDWLTPALAEIRSQIAALSTPAQPAPPLTPPPPQEAAAAETGGAGAAPQAQA